MFTILFGAMGAVLAVAALIVAYLQLRQFKTTAPISSGEELVAMYDLSPCRDTIHSN
jgi:hypothetical protein